MARRKKPGPKNYWPYLSYVSKYSLLACLEYISFEFKLLIADWKVDAKFYILFGRNGNIDLTYLTHSLTAFNLTN